MGSVVGWDELTAACIVVIILLWFVPKVQVYPLRSKLDEAGLFDKENEARKTVAQIIGGVVVLLGFYFTNETLSQSKRQLEALQEQAENARQGQLTDRFSRAIDQLGAISSDGHKRIEVRLGGIYGLERIAKDSDRDYWSTMEVLSAYVREYTPLGARNNQRKVETDVQAALTMLGRRDRGIDHWPLRPDLLARQINLTGTDLSWAQLRGANFENVYLQGAKLDNALLTEAKLACAWLQGASMRYPHLQDADLRCANLRGVTGLSVEDVKKAVNWALAFYDDDLRTALGLPEDHNKRVDDKVKDYHGYPLGRAHLEWQSLKNANLEEADLRYAKMRYAKLAGARLRNARLQGADLRDTDVTLEQISTACISNDTRLPAHIQVAKGQPQKKCM